MADFDGRVAIVTGGACAIGAATATLLAERGARVVVADLKLADAEAVAARIAAAGGTAIACAGDVGREEDVAGIVDAAVAAFGGVDLLNNTAAVTDGVQMARDGALHELDAETWDRAFRINLRGQMLMCKHAVARMIAGRGGAIVNVSSTAGMLTLGSNPSYCASKAAVHALTQGIAARYGRQGVRCNTVAPGLIRTANIDTLDTAFVDMFVRHNALPDIGAPIDIAEGSAFLLSPRARYVTGHLMVIDGGGTCGLPIAQWVVEAATNA